MSQFSYELDERQIRIMLQNAELDYNEAAWQQFEHLAMEPARHTVHVPKFNFGLSRQILVPVFFMVIICGLSALLFSFVDFKKKQTVSNSQAAPVTAGNEDKRETTPPQKSTPPAESPIRKDTVNLAVKKESPAPSQAPVTKAHEAKPAIVAAVAVAKEIPKPVAIVKKEEVKAVAVKKKEEPVVKKKKRRRSQETFEDLPAINTSISNLGADHNEPEPEIRVN